MAVSESGDTDPLNTFVYYLWLPAGCKLTSLFSVDKTPALSLYYTSCPGYFDPAVSPPTSNDDGSSVFSTDHSDNHDDIVAFAALVMVQASGHPFQFRENHLSLRFLTPNTQIWADHLNTSVQWRRSDANLSSLVMARAVRPLL